MRTARVTAAFLSACLLAAPAADAAKKKKAKRARATKTTAPAFLSAIPSDYDQLAVFYDPLPHIQASLASDTARRLRDIAIAGGMDEVPTFDEVRAELEGAQAFVPTESVFAMNDAGVAVSGAIARAVLIGGLCEGAIAAGDAGALATLQGELARELSAAKVRGFTGYARFRDPQTAGMAMAAISGALGQGAKDMPEVKATFEERIIGFELALGVLADPGTSTELLRTMGVVAPGDPAPQNLIDAISAIELQLWIERVADDAIRVTVGPRPGRKVKGMKAKKLGALFSATPQDISYWAWDMDSIDRQLLSWIGLWERWAGTPTGAATREASPELVGNVGEVQRFRRQSAADGKLAIAMRGGTMVLQSLEKRPPAAEPLPGSQLASMIPAAAQMVIADQHVTLNDYLMDVMTVVEELEPDPEMRLATEKVLADYAANFAPGVAVLSGWGDTIQRMTVEEPGEDGQMAKQEALMLPNYGLVFVAALAEGGHGAPLIARAAQGVATLSCTHAEADLPAGTVVMPAKDLGLGVETRVMSLEWLSICSDGAIRVTVDGDLQLHAFDLDGHLVVSTSVAMSKRVIAAHAGAGRRLTLPEAPKKSRLTAYAAFDGHIIAAWVTMIADWVAAFPAEDTEGDVADLRTLAKASRLLGKVRSATYTSKTGRLGTATVEFE